MIGRKGDGSRTGALFPQTRVKRTGTPVTCTSQLLPCHALPPPYRYIPVTSHTLVTSRSLVREGIAHVTSLFCVTCVVHVNRVAMGDDLVTRNSRSTVTGLLHGEGGYWIISIYRSYF